LTTFIIDIKLIIMKKLLALLFVGLALCSGCGENAPSSATVAGLVIDTATAAVSGATVNVSGVSGTTQSNGSYSLTGVTIGLQTVSVSAPGFVSQSKQVSVNALETNYVPVFVLQRADSKSTDVGSGGGEVRNSDGSVIVTVPENALKSSTTITVTKCDVSSAPAPAPTGYKFVSLVYITPVSVSLEKTVTLTIPLPAEVSSESSVPFYRFDTTTLNWVSIGSGAVNAAANTISIEISNFGWIAAAKALGSGYGTVIGRVVSSTGPAIAGAEVIFSSNSSVTDSNGNYTLSNMPGGSATINAYATGYTANSVSVTVAAGVITNASDIVLASTAPVYGTISGQVSSAVSGAAVSGARVTASGKTAYTDSSGNYSITNAVPGSVDVSVYAYGYESKTTGTVVTAGAGSAVNFSLRVVTVTTFSDDFETDKGWVSSISYIYSPKSLWNRIANNVAIKDSFAPVYVTLPDFSTNSGAIPLAHSGSYSYWFGEEDKGCYIGEQQTVPPDTALSGGTSAARYQGDLTSPSITMEGYAAGTLSFWTWWEVESMHSATGFDVMEIKITSDGGKNWTRIATLNPTVDPPGQQYYLPYSSGGFNKEGVWVKHKYDISSYAGKTVQIRFSFSANDVYYNGFRGWFIDDVAVDASAISPSQVK